MAITRDDVLHVAKLARLELEEPEIQRMIHDLGEILEYVGELAAIDTTDVAPTAQVAVDRAPLRADERRPGLPHDTALAAAPRVVEGAFAVPAFVDES